jgi:hypothetical protein
MKYYSLNAKGKSEVIRIVLAACSKITLYPEFFFEMADDAMNDIHGSSLRSFEISKLLTDSKNPERIDVLPEWFDTKIIEDK